MSDTATPESGYQGQRLAPPANFAGQAHCPSYATYEEMYRRSVEDPEGFWAEIAEGFVWEKRWEKVREFSFEHPVSIQWLIQWIISSASCPIRATGA